MKQVLIVIAVVIALIWGGVTVLTKKSETPTAKPPAVVEVPTTPPTVEKPEVGKPPVENPIAEQPTTEKPSVVIDLPPKGTAARILKCNEIITKYHRVRFEDQVLKNDQMTPELKSAFDRCSNKQ